MENGLSVFQKRHGYKKMVMIGDGATDLEARQPGGADIFIGYATCKMFLNVSYILVPCQIRQA